MVFATVDLIYAAGYIIVLSSLFWSRCPPLLFCGLATLHIAFGVLAICGAFPDLPTLTNNNYIIMTHGMLDIFLFGMSIIGYVVVVHFMGWLIT
jgi:hypothetical protein